MTYVVFRRNDGFIHALNTDRSRAEKMMAQETAREMKYLGLFDDWGDAKICIWAQRLEQGWQPSFVADPENGDRDRPGPVGIICEGSFFCRSQATRLVDHPIRKKIPVCDNAEHAIPWD